MRIYLSLCILSFIMALHKSYGQDSLKITKRMYFNIQQWPHSWNPVRSLKTGEINGIQINVFGLDNDSLLKGLKYVLKDEEGYARIRHDPKKLLKHKRTYIFLYLWVVLPKENLYYPISKTKGVNMYDKDEIIIPDRATWQPIKTYFVHKHGMCKITGPGLYFKVK